MFGLSFPELLIIAVLALILLGPDRLPEAARSLGKGLRELRRAGQGVKDQIESELRAEELKSIPSLMMPVPSGDPPAEDEPAAAPTPDAPLPEAPAPAGPTPAAVDPVPGTTRE